eukprot:gb/GFBE01037751.1/.p1 GENE.gb/GFBE01037751.1/~~gb/GFBE01037751.1/.p1  ORF type:complete len:155 (+),score=26.60 gb/GFBE01037751.1/:1-465(+)
MGKVMCEPPWNFCVKTGGTLIEDHHAILILSELDPPQEKEPKKVEPSVSRQKPADAARNGMTQGRHEEFEVRLSKEADKKVGIDVQTLNARYGLPIKQVTGGLAAKWNIDHPDKCLKTGDLIVAVNGATNIAWMLKRCDEDSILNIKVQRHGQV